MAVISLFVLMAVAIVEETAIAVVSLRGVATSPVPMPHCHPDSGAGYSTHTALAPARCLPTADHCFCSRSCAVSRCTC